MDDPVESGLINLHKKTKFLWLAILIGILAIVVISYIIYTFQIIDLKPVVNPVDADKVSLVLIVVIVLVLFFLKRSYLRVSKIKEKAYKYVNKIKRQEFSFLSLEREEHSVFAAAIIYINKIYMMIWLLSELIILVAFVNFILAPMLFTFLIYSFVGLYSLISNYPSIKVYRKLYNYIVS